MISGTHLRTVVLAVTSPLAYCLLLIFTAATFPVATADDARFKPFDYIGGKHATFDSAENRMRELDATYGDFLEANANYAFPEWSRSLRQWVYRFHVPRQDPELGDPTWYRVSTECGFAECLSESQAINAWEEERNAAGICTRNITADGGWTGPSLTSGTVFPTLHVSYQKRYEHQWVYKDVDGSCRTNWQDHFFMLGQHTPISCPEGFDIRFKDDWFECQPKASRSPVIYAKPIPGGCGPCHGNPVDLVRGSKRHSETLYSSDWISYQLQYNSKSGFESKLETHGSFDGGWVDNFSSRLLFTTYDHLIDGIQRADGSYFIVTHVIGDRYVVQGSNDLEIVPDGTEWRLRKPGGDIEVYNRAGFLVRMERVGRSDLWFSYNNRNQLTKIEDSHGRKLQFVRSVTGQLDALIDPAGQQIHLQYSALDRLDAIQYPDGSTRKFLYGSGGSRFVLAGIVDENGDRYATYSYDSWGRVIQSERAGGANRIEIGYLDDGRVMVKEPNDNIVTYSLMKTIQGWMPVAADNKCTAGCSFDSQSATYDNRRRLTSTTDFNGTKTRYVRNEKGRITQLVEADGTSLQRVTLTDWHPDFRLPTKITEPGRITEYTYDANGNRLSETITDTATNETRTTTWTYNTMGLVETVDGPRTDVSDVTTYTYDSLGNLATVTNALGHATQYTQYDAHGNPLEIVDPNGAVTELEYDLRQRLTRRTVAAGTAAEATTTFEYDLAGQLIKTTLPNGAWIAYEYDAAHRLTGMEDNLGNRIDYVLDALSNRIEEKVSGPGGATFRETFRTYNQLNRLVEESGPEGSSIEYAYDAEGNRIETTDAFDNTTTNHYDALNRLFETVDALSGVTAYQYDPRDNLTKVIDPRGVTTNYTYNGFNELIETDSPDAGTTTYQYDAAGNRVSQTDARGITVSYEYDALNRLTFIDYPGTDQDISYTYDQGSNGIGRLSRIDDETGYTEYAYDARGNLTHKLSVVDTASGDQYLPVGYSHDVADNLSSMTYPSGDLIEYQRDAAGHITGISLTRADGTQVSLVTQIQYAPFGPDTARTLGNGISETRTFDGEGRIARIQSGVLDYGYAWNAVSNIVAITDNLDAARNQTFDYDALYRLTDATGIYGNFEWQYDAVGNRLSEAVIPVQTGIQETTSYAYAVASNRLDTVTTGSGTVTYQYDANGNTLDNGGNTFGYDDRNRFVQATDPATQQTIGSYGHNALGQRVVKEIASGTVLFVYDESGHLVGEYDGTGNRIREYVWLGDTPVAMIEGSNVYYLHTDHLNTPKVVTNESQQVVWKGDYAPFGEVDEVVATVEMNLRFPGQYEDAETGLNYNYFRNYDASTGRYTQSDPLGLFGGHNLFLYGVANPNRFVDFYGLDAGPGSPNPRMPTKPKPGWAGVACGLLDGYDAKYHEQYLEDAREQHEENVCKIDESCKQNQENCTYIANPVRFAECIRRVSGDCRQAHESEQDRFKDVIGAIRESQQSIGWLTELCNAF